jgi:hypothetical protein
LDYPELNKVQQFLRELGFHFVNDLRWNPHDMTVVATIPNSKIGKKVENGKTSNRQLTDIRKKIQEKLEINVEFLIQKSSDEEIIEDGLKFLLKEHFPALNLDCFISCPHPDVFDVWLNYEPSMEEQVENTLKSIVIKITDYLNLLSKTLGEIHRIQPDIKLPSLALILRVIKICAPSTPDLLEAEIKSKGFIVPSPQWLRKKLDLLRKQGMIIRQKDDSFVTTELALKIIPHGRYRSSSDIDRALALGRKKW